MSTTIVVVGGGVSGLTSALLLARNPAYTVTVVAKHMPGDYDIEYASPFAGANAVPSENSQWERRTWTELKRLCEEVPEAGIHFQKYHIVRREKDLGGGPNLMFDKNPGYKDLMPGFRELDGSEVVPGYDSGCEFTSVCINTATYLQWLLGQCLRRGVVVKRAVLRHIGEARRLSHTGRPADVVVNATGLGSLRLGGVLDGRMAPARGQIVLVRNEGAPMLACSGNLDSDEGRADLMYIMMRAGGGGTILGGTYELGSWESQPDPDTALRIMSRAVAARPDMAGGRGVAGLSVVRHAVGLRPFREGGARVEEERLDGGGGDGDGDGAAWVVHNYGHAGWGYQASYGCAETVVELVDKIVRGEAKARL